jgi:hypothetical protein
MARLIAFSAGGTTVAADSLVWTITMRERIGRPIAPDVRRTAERLAGSGIRQASTMLTR